MKLDAVNLAIALLVFAFFLAWAVSMALSDAIERKRLMRWLLWWILLATTLPILFALLIIACELALNSGWLDWMRDLHSLKP